MKKVLMIGGSSDLGREMAKSLSYDFYNLDLVNNNIHCPNYFFGDVTNPASLKELESSRFEAVVHIAGIHPLMGSDESAMFPVNVGGVFNTLEQLKNSKPKFVLISSSAAKNVNSTYGKTKALAEKVLEQFCDTHGIEGIALRTRGFTPYYSKSYKNFVDYANWVLGGAVHIQDVVKAVDLSLNTTLPRFSSFVVDGQCDFSPGELGNWSKELLLSKYPEAAELINQLIIKEAPKYGEHENLINYSPSKGINYLFEEWLTYSKINQL